MRRGKGPVDGRGNGSDDGHGKGSGNGQGTGSATEGERVGPSSCPRPWLCYG